MSKNRSSSTPNANTAAYFSRRHPLRGFFVTGAFSVKYLSVDYLKNCVDILYRTNRLLNSSKTDRRTLLEQALTEISVLKRT